MIEGFLGFGENISIKTNKDNDKKTNIEKGIDRLNADNKKGEDVLNLSANKDTFTQMLDEYKSVIYYDILMSLNSTISNAGSDSDDNRRKVATYISALKNFDDGIELLHDFVKNQ